MNQISFGSWCKENNHQDFLDRWDYELNKKTPYEVSITDKSMYYFKCPRGLHESEQHHVNRFHTFKTKNINCSECGSFKQYVIDNYSEEYFEKIWSDKNTENPIKITAKTHNHDIWLKCTHREDHPNYKTQPMNFARGYDCPLCSRIKNGNSLGDKYPQSLDIWSDKNDKTPYDYSFSSNQKVWWKCNNNKHEDYQKIVYLQKNSDFYCSQCRKEEHDFLLTHELLGQKFGLLTVISLDNSYHDANNHWLCQCECGEYITATTGQLNYGCIKTCGNKKLHQLGSNSPAWKGGVTPERMRARSNVAYSEWRDAVYAKDWYTCQCCGKSKGIIKNAHHLQNFSDNIDLRYDVSNGITLCKECHYTTIPGSFHNLYGTTNNTPEQLEEYINNKRQILGINIPFSIQNYLSGDILKPNMIKQELVG